MSLSYTFYCFHCDFRFSSFSLQKQKKASKKHDRNPKKVSRTTNDVRTGNDFNPDTIDERKIMGKDRKAKEFSC